MQVNVHEAKSSLSALLAAVEAGEDVVIARNGKPVVRLTLIETHRAFSREPGWGKDLFVLTGDFDAPLDDEFEAAFRGEGP